VIRQQLTDLVEELEEDAGLSVEHFPPTPPTEEDHLPYAYMLRLDRSKGYVLELTIWTGYYHYPATREQPSDEGWEYPEDTYMRSPFLTDVLSELEDRGVPLPWS